jgi:predicted nucleic acid-binding protein
VNTATGFEKMFLDTSVLIEIFRSPSESMRYGKIETILQAEENLYVSIVQFAEITSWCLANGVAPDEPIGLIQEIAGVMPLSIDICRRASELRHSKRQRKAKFGIIDGMILASARRLGERLLTFDSDFNGETDCTVLR